MKPSILTLRENLTYDPGSGSIRWIASGRGRSFDRDAGTRSSSVGKSRQIEVCGSKISAGVVAWALFYGEYPDRQIVYANGDPADTRICNMSLRAARQSGKAFPSDEEWKSSFLYDPESGAIRRVLCNETIECEKSTKKNELKYKCINFRGFHIGSHRLAWFLHYGSWPSHTIDHINHDGEDNRITNLRDVPHSVNMRNRRLHKTNVSGVAGVIWNKRSQRWHATFCIDGKTRSLGTFPVLEDAVAARRAAEDKYWDKVTIDSIRSDDGTTSYIDAVIGDDGKVSHFVKAE